MRFLLLASTLVHKTHLCDGSVARQALSQGLASFNTQIIGADSDLCSISKASQGHPPSIETKPSIAKYVVSVSSKHQTQQQTNSKRRMRHAEGMHIVDKVAPAASQPLVTPTTQHHSPSSHCCCSSVQQPASCLHRHQGHCS